MKKNGFIATSILYSFFLVFVTLFVALIANYLHNRVLISKIDEAARETLLGINNTKLTDLEVGDRIKFAHDVQDHILNPDATWTVAYIETSGNNKKYYFISDLTAQNMDIYYKLPSDKIIKYHTMSLEIYNQLKADVVNNQDAYSRAMLYDGFNLNIPTSSFLSAVRNSNINEDIKKSIFNAGGSFVVYIDGTIPGYEQNAYYELRGYNFSLGSQQLGIIPAYCGGSFANGNVNYNTNNKFGYISVMRESAVNNEYVDYCCYASPIAYSHNSNQHVVTINESRDNDKLIASHTSNYNYRLVADITLNVNNENTYIIGGRGTLMDPYLFTNGVKQS